MRVSLTWLPPVEECRPWFVSLLQEALAAAPFLLKVNRRCPKGQSRC